jgi:uncharacterized membrane protein
MRIATALSTGLSAALLLAGCQRTAEPAERTPSPDAEAAAVAEAGATPAGGPGHGAATTQEEPAMPTGPTDPATTPASPAAAGKRAPGQENAPVAAWRAFGNEPFWSVRVDGDTLVFSTPENQAGTVLQARRVPSLVGVVMLGEENGREFNLSIAPGECSDGMSDNRYQHTATWMYRDTTYHGCAEQAKAK